MKRALLLIAMAALAIVIAGMQVGSTLAAGKGTSGVTGPERNPAPFSNLLPGWHMNSDPYSYTYHVRSGLMGVAALAPNDVWAVGQKGDLPYSDGNVIEHFDGAWNSVQAPEPGTDYQRLSGVAAIQANNIWAVGAYMIGQQTYPQILHWNGSTWAQVSVPNYVDNAELRAVTAISANDIWAVGDYLDGNTQLQRVFILHWNGNTWGRWGVQNNLDVSGSGNYMTAVTAVSSTDVWAVGYYGGYTCTNHCTNAISWHWNGSNWSKVYPPYFGSWSQFLGVSAIGQGNLWAVGQFLNDQGNQYFGLVALWTGSQWVQASEPAPLFSKLTAVTTAGPNNVWAVGYANKLPGNNLHDGTVTIHWDGSAWSLVSSPNAVDQYGDRLDSHLMAVAARGTDEPWAVGFSSMFPWDFGHANLDSQVEVAAPLTMFYIAP